MQAFVFGTKALLSFLSRRVTPLSLLKHLFTYLAQLHHAFPPAPADTADALMTSVQQGKTEIFDLASLKIQPLFITQRALILCCRMFC